ncbi:hypothetical protein DES40_1705 [Litorimonas taeanensis]|uniref:Uncharacterized protein n=1 Tax=Litorimonas taeanensis TaxID=568099 RepID=A0A420WD30_9PROT|nr:hypothetical protein [Litorimonas taeanensis]RKQ68929.1 hypothetical protein DES40_1705 [Litorimonas taeanensis]
MQNSKLTHAVFDKHGTAFIAGTSRQDCLLQLIGTDTPDALLEAEWRRDWAVKGFQVQKIKRIRPADKGLSGYDLSPDYGSQDGGQSANFSLITGGIVTGLSLALLAVIIGRLV